MKRFSSLLNKRSKSDAGLPEPNANTPEGSISRGVKLFCESGGPNNAAGEEVLHLPGIVESAESSPAAAKEAAYVIRKFLSKDHYSRGYVQYNAVMLVRILSDNPGPSFTRNLEGKFVTTTKDLLRDGRDMSVQQILRETLDTLETKETQDETLKPLITMWRAEKGKFAKRNGSNQSVPRNLAAPPFNEQSGHFSRNHSRPKTLPPPHELASRIEEAKTSSKLLLQVVQTTPPNEIFHNDLVKEFADRCQSASRSVQAYIAADNPPPDNDTLQTLIETNDQLAQALSKHQRALLQARRLLGGSPSHSAVASPYPSPPPLQQPPVQPPRPDARATTNGLAPLNTTFNATSIGPPPGPPPQQRLHQPLPLQPQPQLENPFADPTTTTAARTQPPTLPPPRQYPNGIAATSGPLAPAFPPQDPDPSRASLAAQQQQQQQQLQQQQPYVNLGYAPLPPPPVQNGFSGGAGHGGGGGGSAPAPLQTKGGPVMSGARGVEEDEESDVESPDERRNVQYRF